MKTPVRLSIYTGMEFDPEFDKISKECVIDRPIKECTLEDLLFYFKYCAATGNLPLPTEVGEYLDPFFALILAALEYLKVKTDELIYGYECRIGEIRHKTYNGIGFFPDPKYERKYKAQARDGDGITICLKDSTAYFKTHPTGKRETITTTTGSRITKRGLDGVRAHLTYIPSRLLSVIRKFNVERKYLTMVLVAKSAFPNLVEELWVLHKKLHQSSSREIDAAVIWHLLSQGSWRYVTQLNFSHYNEIRQAIFELKNKISADRADGTGMVLLPLGDEDYYEG